MLHRGVLFLDMVHAHLGRNEAMAKKVPSAEREVDAATEELMRVIDEHHLSGSDVPQAQTLDLLRALRSAIDMRIETIRQEMSE